MAKKKSAVIVSDEVEGGRFLQVDRHWLVARPMETPLEAGTTIKVTVKSGNVVPFMVLGNNDESDKTIFSVLAFTNEIVYWGVRTDK